MVPISIRMHRIESMETSNRKYLSKTILACRELRAKNVNEAAASVEMPVMLGFWGFRHPGKCI